MSSVSSHNAVAASFPVSSSWPALFSNVRDELGALRSTSGLYRADRAKLRLTGSDRVRWLNGMITNNIRDLAQGHGVYAFLLNPQGHILGDLFAFQQGDALLVDTDPQQLEKILATFDHYIIMDDVEVSDISSTTAAIGLTGPNSQAVLNAAGLTAPEMYPLQFSQVTLGGISATLVRGVRPEYPSYELWMSPEHATNMLSLLQQSGATPVGQEALELYRILLGAPRYGQDIRERDLPQETEQAQALNFNKGCYVGQEIVERIRSRGNVHRKFTGFRISGALPANGCKIQEQGKDVGEITSTAIIPGPQGDQAVALGYIRRELSAPGKEVQIGGTFALVADLPFADLLNK